MPKTQFRSRSKYFPLPGPGFGALAPGRRRQLWRRPTVAAEEALRPPASPASEPPPRTMSRVGTGSSSSSSRVEAGQKSQVELASASESKFCLECFTRNALNVVEETQFMYKPNNIRIESVQF